MKRKLSFIAASLLLSGSVFAAKPVNLAPVAWHSTMQNGGFVYENQTDQVQYVQVAIHTGEIYVLTIHNGAPTDCRKDLNADSGPYSVVCKLAPHDTISGDIDFATRIEATGTYQVKMENIV